MKDLKSEEQNLEINAGFDREPVELLTYSPFTYGQEKCDCIAADPGSTPGPGPFAACHSPSLSPCFLSYLQLYFQ